MTEKTSSRNTIIFAIIGGAVVAILIAAVLFGGSTEETGDPQVNGALPSMQTASSSGDPAAGQPAPEVVGEDFDGSEVRIENDGTAKAIVFLAHWCPHCQREVPAVQSWVNATGGVEGVEIYSVATAINSARGNYPPSDWLESEGWTAPVVKDSSSSSVLAAYGNGGFPFWVFTNSDGSVALRVEGEIPIESLQAIMESLT